MWMVNIKQKTNVMRREGKILRRINQGGVSDIWKG